MVEDAGSSGLIARDKANETTILGAKLEDAQAGDRAVEASVDTEEVMREGAWLVVTVFTPNNVVA
jgi:hypothetical protein